MGFDVTIPLASGTYDFHFYDTEARGVYELSLGTFLGFTVAVTKRQYYYEYEVSKDPDVAAALVPKYDNVHVVRGYHLKDVIGELQDTAKAHTVVIDKVLTPSKFSSSPGPIPHRRYSSAPLAPAARRNSMPLTPVSDAYFKSLEYNLVSQLLIMAYASDSINTDAWPIDCPLPRQIDYDQTLRRISADQTDGPSVGPTGYESFAEDKMPKSYQDD